MRRHSESHCKSVLERGKFVPLGSHAVKAGHIRAPQLSFELQIVGRVGENHVGGFVRLGKTDRQSPRITRQSAPRAPTTADNRSGDEAAFFIRRIITQYGLLRARFLAIAGSGYLPSNRRRIRASNLSNSSPRWARKLLRIFPCIRPPGRVGAFNPEISAKSAAFFSQRMHWSTIA